MNKGDKVKLFSKMNETKQRQNEKNKKKTQQHTWNIISIRKTGYHQKQTIKIIINEKNQRRRQQSTDKVQRQSKDAEQTHKLKKERKNRTKNKIKHKETLAAATKRQGWVRSTLLRYGEYGAWNVSSNAKTTRATLQTAQVVRHIAIKLDNQHP